MNLRRTLATCAGLLIVFLHGGSNPHTVLAQGAGTWQPATQLAVATANDTQNESSVYAPVIVADGWGNAHAFWQASSSDNTGTLDGSVVYSRWDETGWSDPVDVFFAARRIPWSPQAAVDAQGMLHLIWESGTGGDIMYSSAPVGTAASALNWSMPEAITDSRRFVGEMTKSLVATPGGEVHVVYCTGDERSSIEYRHLSEEWTPPLTVQSSTAGFCRVNLAVDERGRLHLVYVFSESDGNKIFYTQSDDQGASWSTPFELAAWQPGFAEGYGPNFPGILVDGDNVHIVWLGYPRTQRWHRWSSDRGATWSEPRALAPELLLATDAPTMVGDRSGSLHLVTIGSTVGGGGGERVYYATWRDGAWTPLVELFSEADERAALALTTDGILHLIWDNDEGAARSIMVSSLALGEAAAPLKNPALPQTAVTPTGKAVTGLVTPAPSPVPQPTLSRIVATDSGVAPERTLDSLAVITVGSLAAGVVVLVGILIAWKRMYR